MFNKGESPFAALSLTDKQSSLQVPFQSSLPFLMAQSSGLDACPFRVQMKKHGPWSF